MLENHRVPLTSRKKVELIINDNLNYKNLPLKFSNDDYEKTLRGITMVKNDIYWKPFHDTIQRLFEAGITNLRPRANILDQYFKLFEVYDKANHDNVVLTMHLLSAGFYVWIAFVVFSLLIFLAEIIMHRIKSK